MSGDVHTGIYFKTVAPAYGPTQLRVYQSPFYTLGVDYVGELPVSSLNYKWIIKAVRQLSNYLRSVPVPDKLAPTAEQSDRGGEWINALLHRVTNCCQSTKYLLQVLDLDSVVLLNALITFQVLLWECFANIIRRNGGSICSQLFKHTIPLPSRSIHYYYTFLVFGRDPLSPECISLDLPASPLPPGHYAKQLVSRLTEANSLFKQIRADLRRRQRDDHDCRA